MSIKKLKVFKHFINLTVKLICTFH